MKVSIIGAGNVGGTLAQRIVEANLCEVVLLDIISGLAQGKALDMQDASPIIGHQRQIEGTTDFQKISNSDIVVITAGLARQPGMSREDLLKKNSQTIKEVVAEIIKYTPNSLLLVVTNPLDILTYVALKASGFSPKKVMGMGGVLDSSRFAHLIAEELKVPESDVEALVIGAHAETMLALARFCRVKGKNLTEILDKKKLDKVVADTVKRGAQIVSLLGKGSAYYAPSAAAFSMVKAILKDEKKIVPACVYLDGQYGLKDVCIGVPIKLGKNGVEEIIELDLTQEEKKNFIASTESIKTQIANLSI